MKRVAAILGWLVIALAIADAGPRPRGGLIGTTRPVRAARQLGPRHDIGAWHASWDRDLDVPIAMWGPHVDAPGALANAAIALRAAQQFLAAHLAELAPGASIDDFRVVANQLDRDRSGRNVRTIGFQQTWRGLRVIDAQIGIVFRNDRLFALTSTAMPNVVGDSLATTANRVVLPLVHGPGDVEYRVADVVDVRGTGERWDVFVAPDGTQIGRASCRERVSVVV